MLRITCSNQIIVESESSACQGVGSMKEEGASIGGYQHPRGKYSGERGTIEGLDKMRC